MYLFTHHQGIGTNHFHHCVYMEHYLLVVIGHDSARAETTLKGLPISKRMRGDWLQE